MTKTKERSSYEIKVQLGRVIVLWYCLVSLLVVAREKFSAIELLPCVIVGGCEQKVSAVEL